MFTIEESICEKKLLQCFQTTQNLLEIFQSKPPSTKQYFSQENCPLALLNIISEN
jgi:hypothetical protein